MTKEELKQVVEICYKINICSCGTNAAWRVIYKLLVEAEDHKENDGFYVSDEAEFGAKVLDSWGLLEHGTGIGFAWLTPNGKLVLKAIREYSYDDFEHNIQEIYEQSS